MKRKKLKPQQKKDINKVINKWLPSKLNTNFSKKFSIGTGAIGTSIAAADLILLGGAGLFAISVPFYALSALGARDINNYPFLNKANQKIKSPLKIAWATKYMEARASTLFNSLSNTKDSKRREIILEEFKSIQSDLNILRPAMNFKSDNLDTEFKFRLGGEIKTFEDIYNYQDKNRLKDGFGV